MSMVKLVRQDGAPIWVNTEHVVTVVDEPLDAGGTATSVGLSNGHILILAPDTEGVSELLGTPPPKPAAKPEPLKPAAGRRR